MLLYFYNVLRDRNISLFLIKLTYDSLIYYKWATMVILY